MLSRPHPATPAPADKVDRRGVAVPDEGVFLARGHAGPRFPESQRFARCLGEGADGRSRPAGWRAPIRTSRARGSNSSGAHAAVPSPAPLSPPLPKQTEPRRVPPSRRRSAFRDGRGRGRGRGRAPGRGSPFDNHDVDDDDDDDDPVPARREHGTTFSSRRATTMRTRGPPPRRGRPARTSRRSSRSATRRRSRGSTLTRTWIPRGRLTTSPSSSASSARPRRTPGTCPSIPSRSPKSSPRPPRRTPRPAATSTSNTCTATRRGTSAPPTRASQHRATRIRTRDRWTPRRRITGGAPASPSEQPAADARAKPETADDDLDRLLADDEVRGGRRNAVGTASTIEAGTNAHVEGDAEDDELDELLGETRLGGFASRTTTRTTGADDDAFLDELLGG